MWAGDLLTWPLNAEVWIADDSCSPDDPPHNRGRGAACCFFFLLLVVGVAARARLVSHVSMSLVLRSLGHRLCCARVTRALRSR